MTKNLKELYRESYKDFSIDELKEILNGVDTNFSYFPQINKEILTELVNSAEGAVKPSIFVK